MTPFYPKNAKSRWRFTVAKQAEGELKTAFWGTTLIKDFFDLSHESCTKSDSGQRLITEFVAPLLALQRNYELPRGKS
jgi:hypothetical protein